MKVEFKSLAEETLTVVAEFTEDSNTHGAGERWMERIVNEIYDQAKLKSGKWPLCRHQKLAGAGWGCLVYRGWVIAFEIQHGVFVVHRIIWGALLE